MVDQDRSEIIRDNPIGNSLEAFLTSFSSLCGSKDIPYSGEALDQLGNEEFQNVTIDLFLALQQLRVPRLLRFGSSNLLSHLLRYASTITSGDFDYDRVKPLLRAVVAKDSDEKIWAQVYHAVTESTPPPRPTASSLQQTPWLRNTSSFANSSEHRKHVDAILEEELGTMYVGLRRFHETFFGDVAGLQTASEAVFAKCGEGGNPLFADGWIGWPPQAGQEDVLSWFQNVVPQLLQLAQDCRPITVPARRLITQPNNSLEGSTAERKLDIGFVDDSTAKGNRKYHWSQILVPGELKSNRNADKSKTWLDIGRYAREVLSAQDTRRFVMAFTLCGPLMRIWEFDRLGGIASDQFDINEDGLRFVSTILGFLWMSEEQLGFDPTIITSGGERYIEITRDGSPERLIFDGAMRRAPCIAGRATTCWKAHSERDPRTPLVIKDSWQYTEREEEGLLLEEVTNKGVVNMARHYHHYTVQVRGATDDVRGNVRKGLDITMAENYRSERSIALRTVTAATSSREGRSMASRKRLASQTDAPLPSTKRSCSVSPTKVDAKTLPNRVHRRVILRDYGQPIYKASSRMVLLGALEGCIEGHESLHRAGILHRDISANNIMINEDASNPSWPSFLIDLDLAIKEQRKGASGARGRTGTRAFMAIGALLGEQHSFMHDLESFFWVLFWICIHYNGPGKAIGETEFGDWNNLGVEELARLKKGEIDHEGDFIKRVGSDFTPYFQPLAPWINRLRKVVFPNGGRWEKEDETLYSRMRDILREAQEDPNVLNSVTGS
ncbi:hypothetical protein F5B19DRAFT_175473 [Rostrohypoxylon terebratum]|nr:hypothetical protein F5B19DRAFT_175473 [Rostrohypoxylon terebratum]